MIEIYQGLVLLAVEAFVMQFGRICLTTVSEIVTNSAANLQMVATNYGYPVLLCHHC